MKVETDAKLVSVYLNSTDQWHGRPLYSAIVHRCQEMGIAGATVFRTEEGYGAGGQLHTPRLLELSQNLPLKIEIIDVEERVEPLLTMLETMVHQGLVVVADVHMRRYLPDAPA